MDVILIGAGRIGQRHAHIIQQYGRLLAVCDPDKEAAHSISGLHPIEVFSSFEELMNSSFFQEKLAHEATLGRLLAVVASPNHLHPALTLSCLQAGFHVLCEKPMSIHYKDALQMEQTAILCQRKLFIVKQLRLTAAVQTAKKWLNEGLLGNILSVQLNCFWNRNPAFFSNSNWKGRKQLDGGPLYTQFSHYLDAMLIFTGKTYGHQAVFANITHQQLMDTEDTGAVLFKFGENSIGSVHYTISTFQKNLSNQLTILGNKGTVQLGGEYMDRIVYANLEGQTVNLDQIHQSGPSSLEAFPAFYKAIQSALYDKPSNLPGHGSSNVSAILPDSYWIEALQDAMHTVQFIELALQSNRSSGK
jgi:UDP-N-acetyl-2-amino-2-deoxyglucuronate dehydrogenase